MDVEYVDSLCCLITKHCLRFGSVLVTAFQLTNGSPAEVKNAFPPPPPPPFPLFLFPLPFSLFLTSVGNTDQLLINHQSFLLKMYFVMDQTFDEHPSVHTSCVRM